MNDSWRCKNVKSKGHQVKQRLIKTNRTNDVKITLERQINQKSDYKGSEKMSKRYLRLSTKSMKPWGNLRSQRLLERF